MTPEEIRQNKDELVSHMHTLHHEINTVKQQLKDEISKVEASYYEKCNELNDKLNVIHKELDRIQKACNYHRIEGFYGTCPDCAYYVRDTRRDGLEAHP